MATVEKAAAAKIFLEVYFHDKLHKQDSRAMRNHYLETQLHYSVHLSEEQKAAIRTSFWMQESHTMRKMRDTKSITPALNSRGNADTYHKHYESLKVLGKGSFGVVRLVQERLQPGEPARPKQVFAMKIIRKSNMLRSNQEGHLRAERDFLVASEGSKW